MEHEIALLEKEKWKGFNLPIGYTTNAYYDVSAAQTAGGFEIKIQKKEFPAPVSHSQEEYGYPDNLYADWWEQARAYGIVENGRLLAAVELCPEEWSNRMIVTELWVSEELRGQGIGKKLIDLAKDETRGQKRRALILETQSCNVNAVDFYLHQGFRLIGLDTCCYANDDLSRKEVRLNMGWFPEETEGNMGQVFESDRIRFVEVSERLVPDYLTMINDYENVNRFIGGSHKTFTEEQERKWVRKKLQEKASVFSMLEKQSGAFIGNVELRNGNDSVGELGISITAAMQNAGFGTEAVSAIVKYGMRRLGLEKIVLRAHPDNGRALHVYQKCGFREYDRSEDHVYMEFCEFQRVNILLEGYDIDAPWLFPALERYVRPWNTVAVIAFSFRDDVKGPEDWNALYGRDAGRYYDGIARSFRAYGIAEEQIRFVDYFSHSAEEAARIVGAADILYFPGGLPDRMLARIRESGIYDAILRHRGVIMGYSAGALIQLREYHLSPDADYPAFGYYKGLPLLDGFYLEPHYEGSAPQKDAIRRVLAERQKPVYATATLSGAIVVTDHGIQTIGDVKRFGDEKDLA